MNQSLRGNSSCGSKFAALARSSLVSEVTTKLSLLRIPSYGGILTNGKWTLPVMRLAMIPNTTEVPIDSPLYQRYEIL